MIMDPYVYPGTNILKNKFDIQDKKELENLERRISNKNAVHILKTDNSFKCSLSYLQQIHKKLFQEIYPWAGEIRTVNIGKGNIFCLVENIASYSEFVFYSANSVLKNKPKNLYEKITSIANVLRDLNALHPFREGNGRSARLFMIEFAKELNIQLDFSKLDPKTYLEASIKSFTGDNSRLEEILYNCSSEIKKSNEKGR